MTYPDLQSFRPLSWCLSQLRRLRPYLWIATRWVAVVLFVIAGAALDLVIWAKLANWDVESRLPDGKVPVCAQCAALRQNAPNKYLTLPVWSAFTRASVYVSD